MFRQKQVFAVLFGLLFCLAAALPNVSVVSFGVPPDVYAQGNSPSVTIEFGPSASVPVGTAIEVTMRFHDLTFFAQDNETRLIFRADVVGADQCEDNADGLGVERYMWKVDENPEVRTGMVLASCPAGDYTIAGQRNHVRQYRACFGQRKLHHRRACVSANGYAHVDTRTYGHAYTYHYAYSHGHTPYCRLSRGKPVGDDRVWAVGLRAGRHGHRSHDALPRPDVLRPRQRNQAHLPRRRGRGRTSARTTQMASALSVICGRWTRIPKCAPGWSWLAVRRATTPSQASVTTSDNTELASASASFTIAAPASQPTATPTSTPAPTATPTPTTAPTATATPPIADSPEESPSVTIEFGPSASVPVGTAIEVTMRFHDLTFFAQDNETRLIFRADVVGADQCEDNADGLGVERYMWKVDENPEVRTGMVLASCPAGDYTIAASVTTSDNTELASASASFTIAAPASQQTATPTSTPAPTVTITPTFTPTRNSRAISAIVVASNPWGTSPATVSWNPPADTPDDYQVNWARADESYPTGADNNAYPTDTSYTITGLENVRHKVRVRARYNSSFGPWIEVEEFGGPGPTSTPTPTATATASLIPTATVTLTATATATTEVTDDNASDDKAVLVAFYNDTGGSDWTNNSNWLSDKPLSSWAGVTTDSNGRVTQLNLSSNNLRGSLSSELGQLTSLRRLNLMENRLRGSIPSELGSLSLLENLNLARNYGLNGPLPSELGSLSNLEVLRLDENTFTGTIPPELGNLSNLQHLSLFSNNLSGAIPSELGNLSKLVILNLSHNNLSGAIPAELGNLSNLECLGLESNNLSGAIPSELGNLSKLVILNLSHNNLSGAIPAELGNLSNLQHLSLFSNNLTGTIPSELGNLLSLESLHLSWNSLTGSIPSELGNLSNLVALYLESGNLSGNIPSELGNLSNLQHLLLFSNNLTGTIPSELGNLSKLVILNLSHNNLSGAIPAELGNLSNLDHLGLDSNNLSGAIPSELGNLSKLVILNLSHNNLSGAIPAELGNLSKLAILDLSGNEFTGCVPAVLRNLTGFSDDLDSLGLPFCEEPTSTPTATTPPPAPSNPPGVPDTPSGEVTAPGRVALDWNNVAEAASYQVRVWIGAKWIELPGNGYNIVVEGSSAQISNLPTEGFYYFSVRAVNAAGSSEWSGFNSMNSQHR